MCIICALPQLAAKDRWPKPVEGHKPSLALLVTSVHDEYQTYQKQKSVEPSLKLTEGLLDKVRMLADQLDVLEAEREAWWTSPEKRRLRQRLEEDCDRKKLSDLHRINNLTSSSIETLSARLGQFVRWSLSMEGGVSGLVKLDGD